MTGRALDALMEAEEMRRHGTGGDHVPFGSECTKQQHRQKQTNRRFNERPGNAAVIADNFSRFDGRSLGSRLRFKHIGRSDRISSSDAVGHEDCRSVFKRRKD
ncbi:MAG: hypothetical protein B7Z43_11115 [Sphingomonas sp. 12-62-6]|nr:MAG: hypothetical protein B7Z43_11115 [Sphingomonas sp. 12-62-6]